jgi:hypothetical protein
MGIASLVLSLALAQGDAKAQEGLTPTDILSMGRFTAAGYLGASIGQASLEANTFDEDGDIREFLLRLEVAVGLGAGFEVEASLPIALMSELEFDSGGVEFKQESKGLGDLTLGLNYALIQETKDAPQLLIGAFVVLPTGDDEAGEPEIVVNNVVVQDGEDAGFGTGAFQYGFQVGLSKRAGQVEPYLLFRYLFGGTGDDGDVETEFANVGTLLLGMEIHAGDQLTIDIRGILEFRSDEVEEDEFNNETTEEAHVSYGLQGRLYASLGSQVALVLGLGAFSTQDHAINEESDLDLTGVIIITAEVGLQISFGK